MKSEPFRAQEILEQAAWAQRVARAMVRDEHLAEDIAQDALEASLRRKTASRGGLQAWLYGTVRNLRRQAARKEGNLRKRELTASPAEPQAKPDELLERAEMQRAVIEAVIRLPEVLRSALILRYYEDLPVREVARSLGVTENAAELRIQRGLQQLRESFASRLGASWILGVAPLLHSPAAAIPATLAKTFLMTAKSKYLVAGACALILIGAFVAFNGMDADSVPDSPSKGIENQASGPPPLPDAGSLTDPLREAFQAPEAATDSAAVLRVEVRAAHDDAPLAQAQILLSDKPFGVTDELGNFSAPWPAQILSGKVSVTFTGYLPWEAEVVPQDEPFRITLVRTGVIRGRLVSADGNTDWEGMSVLAHPADMTADRAVVAAALTSGHSAVKRVATDGSGWFELAGVPADKLYSLHAGGSGWISPVGLQKVAVDGAEVQLKVRKLFGLHIRYRGPDGGPLRVHEQLHDETPHGMLVPESSTSDFVTKESPATLLLPFALPQGNWFSAYERWILYCLNSDTPVSLPFGIFIPGYKPFAGEVQLDRARETMPSKEVRLEPLTDEWGSIAVTLTGLPPCLPNEIPAPGSRAAPQLSISLLPLNLPTAAHTAAGVSRQYPFGAAVPDPRLVKFLLDGVPAAAYQVGWMHSLGLSMLPGEDTIQYQDLLVKKDETAELTLDFSGTGAVRILAAEGSAPLRGRILFQVSTPNGEVGHLNLWEAPYLVYGLAPGEYRFRIAPRRPSPPDSPPTVVALVEAGRFTEVLLPPPE